MRESINHFSKLLHYITNRKTFNYSVLCTIISFPLYPLYPQGLRQTATFSIQEILEHFRLTIYPTTRDGFWIKRFYLKLDYSQSPISSQDRQDRALAYRNGRLSQFHINPRERASGFIYPSWPPVINAESSIPTILRKNRGLWIEWWTGDLMMGKCPPSELIINWEPFCSISTNNCWITVELPSTCRTI